MREFSDIDPILYNGTKKELSTLRCPACGGEIFYTYTAEVPAFTRGCKTCGDLIRGFGGVEPNCAKFFGSSGVLPIAKGLGTAPER